MDKDIAKGKWDEIKGKVKGQAGRLTGDEELESEGAVDEVKGKTEGAWGKLKDKVQEIADDVHSGAEKAKRDVNREPKSEEESDRVIDRKRDVA
jgi:uncharacterized protein YjbJ (UPF0337 family)